MEQLPWPQVKAGDTVQIFCLRDDSSPSLLVIEDLKDKASSSGCGMPAGGIREDETFIWGAHRELEEETGLCLLEQDGNEIWHPFAGTEPSIVLTEERYDGTKLFVLRCSYVPEMGEICVNDPEDKVIQALWVPLHDFIGVFNIEGRLDAWGRRYYNSHLRRIEQILRDIPL